MSKSFLAVVGITAVAGASFYISTKVGLQTEGWHEVTVEVPRHPGYASVGQTYTTPDGNEVLVNAVRRERGKHVVDVSVQGTHRYVLALSPMRFEHSFAMDRASMEWTLRQASGSSGPFVRTGGRIWHVLN